MERITESTEEQASSSPVSPREALLFVTMCIVGLPVEVHIKDGSIFSGVFHTANVEEAYGVVLKSARMIRKGARLINVADGALIETLVVRSHDLVQVIAKGVTILSDNDSGAASHNDGEGILRPTSYSQRPEDGGVVCEAMNQERKDAADRPQEQKEDSNHPSESTMKEASEVNGSSTSSNACSGEVSVFSDAKHMNQFHDTSRVSDSEFKLDNRTAKESKLNPGAKVFSPSSQNLRSTPPPLPTMAYTPISISQPEVRSRPFPPRSSWPVKVYPYANHIPTNTDNALQYGQQIAGCIASRGQYTRHGTQYQPIQALPSYIHPTPQNAMFGRPGQVVYVHPVTHDAIQGPAAFTHAPYPMLTSHPIHFAKHEGVLTGQAMPVSATPPQLMNSAAQPFPQFQYSQPLMVPLPFLSSNGPPYSAKFP